MSDNNETFVGIAFREFWDNHRIEDPDEVFSMKDAFNALRNCTGLSRESIARHLGISVSYLSKIEFGKTIIRADLYDELRALSKSYSLPRLAAFFERCADKSRDAQAPSKSRGGKKSKGAMPDWRDQMGVG